MQVCAGQSMNTQTSESPPISIHHLRDFAASLLQRGGFTRSQAEETADMLVWANARGVHTHGVMRIPSYFETIRSGEVHPDAQMRVLRREGAVCVLEADRAPGATAMLEGVRVAARLADEQGIGWCAVRQTAHAGAVGYFVERLTRMGKAGIAMTASRPLMAYYGARGKAVSTNPIAIGVPRPDGLPPIILDMSTAAVPMGKIFAAREAGEPIPVGWGVDANGADTTDPHGVVAVLPMAGPKGSGLALMIEILCAVLVGNPNIAPILGGGKFNGFNGMMLAINPDAFGDGAGFLAHVEALAKAIHGLDPAPGVESVLLPGERGHQAQRKSETEGVRVPAATVARLLQLAAERAVPVPVEWASLQA